jgi:hypothetical protein
MKKKITKIWGVGLTLMLMATLLIGAAPASALTLGWGSETLVTTANNVLVTTAGLDIVDFDVAGDGQTIYAVTGAVDNKIYKSSDAGVSWTGLTAPAAITGAVNRIAVAPDDDDLVVILGNIGALTTNLTAYATTNGGSTWSALGLIQSGTAVAATALYDVDIAPVSSGIHYVACAGTAGANLPGVYYFNLGSAAPTWKNACITAATDFTSGITLGTGAADAVTDSIRAVQFSPNFASDKVLLAVSEQIGTAAPAAGAASLQIIHFASYQWNTVAGFTSYPVALETSTNVAFNVGSASIAVAPDYLGSDDTLRVSFVGLQITDGTNAAELGGIYRLSDVTLKDMKTAGIYSIDFDGTNLVAGATTDGTGTASNVVWRSADPLASTPTVSAARSLKRPGGQTMVVVAWAGSDVVAGTTGDESAFAVSRDNGKSFNDISLIDTALTNIEDVYISPDGSKTYMLTNDQADAAGDGFTDFSVWRKASSWERVFTLRGTVVFAAYTPFIVRGAPENTDVVYVARTAGTAIYYTTDAGEEKWTIRAFGTAAGIQDLAVESADVAYGAVSGAQTVSKSTNGGFTWATAKNTQLAGGTVHTIASIAEDQIIVGSTTGYVSYSTDGNESWTKISKIIQTAAGLTQVTASGLNTDDYIYAASDMLGAAAATNVVRWQIGTSASWKNLLAPTTADNDANLVNELYAAYGIALQDGVLYVAAEDHTAATNNSVVLRTLSPTVEVPSAGFWSTLFDAGTTYVSAPSALRLSTGSIKLWVIDTTGVALRSFTDTLADVTIELIAPADGFSNPANPVTGRSQDIVFSWTKPSDNVTAYQIRIYSDEAGANLLVTNAPATTSTTAVTVMGPYQPVGAVGANPFIEFTPGQTYYWRVRVGGAGPIFSPYSEMRSFTIEPGSAAVPSISSPENGKEGVSLKPSFSWTPVSGATEYQFKLADNVALASPMVDVKVKATGYALTTELENGKTYYWSVKAIAPVKGEWSALANFTVKEKAVAPAPPIVVKEVPPPVINIPPQPAPPAPPPDIIIPPAPAPPAPITPAYIWAIVIIGAVLVILVIVLIVRTRRPV